MRKIPHKLMCNAHSDYDLDHLLSPYEKKYSITLFFKVRGYKFFDYIEFGESPPTFRMLRELIHAKHFHIETIDSSTDEQLLEAARPTNRMYHHD